MESNSNIVSRAETAKQSSRLFSAIITSVVGILFLVTFFQAIEIGRLRGYAQAQEPGAAPVAANANQPANPAPAVNTGLPSQVGGC
ncbi:MAG: hypothetical protein Q8Q23_05955 [bacterium]|nr:hypothetical protein [bacterium]